MCVGGKAVCSSCGRCQLVLLCSSVVGVVVKLLSKNAAASCGWCLSVMNKLTCEATRLNCI